MTEESKKTILKRVERICKTLRLKSVPSHSQTIGRLGELFAIRYFKLKGYKVKPLCLLSDDAKYDLDVEGRKIEVKTSLKNKKGKYSIIFARNREQDKNRFDDVLVVLFPAIDKYPMFYLVEGRSIEHLTGLSRSLDAFNRYIYTGSFSKHSSLNGEKPAKVC